MILRLRVLLGLCPMYTSIYTSIWPLTQATVECTGFFPEARIRLRSSVSHTKTNFESPEKCRPMDKPMAYCWCTQLLLFFFFLYIFDRFGIREPRSVQGTFSPKSASPMEARVLSAIGAEGPAETPSICATV